MSDGMITALSGALARQQRLDDISHNLANVDTPGYRQRRVSFESVLIDETNGIYNTQRGKEGLDLSDGSLAQTGNPLDVAIVGKGFFRIGGGEKGKVQLTRNGQFRMSTQGQLQTISGKPVLDTDGNPIVLQATPGELMIGEGGDIWDGYGMVATIGIVDLQDPKALKAAGQGMYTTDAKNLMPTASGEIKQGMVEKGNVNPVRSMTEMIMVHRHFDAMQRLIQMHKRVDDRAINVGQIR